MTDRDRPSRAVSANSIGSLNSTETASMNMEFQHPVSRTQSAETGTSVQHPESHTVTQSDSAPGSGSEFHDHNHETPGRLNQNLANLGFSPNETSGNSTNRYSREDSTSPNLTGGRSSGNVPYGRASGNRSSGNQIPYGSSSGNRSSGNQIPYGRGSGNRSSDSSNSHRKRHSDGISRASQEYIEGMDSGDVSPLHHQIQGIHAADHQQGVHASERGGGLDDEDSEPEPVLSDEGKLSFEVIIPEPVLSDFIY
jgi:hypothetical protein